MKTRLFVLIAVIVAGTFLWLNYEMIFSSAETEFFESEEEEEENPILSGAGKQMSEWWLARAYPDPTDISGKYDRAWQQHLALKEKTKRVQEKTGLRKRKSDGLMGTKRKVVPGKDLISGTAGTNGTSESGLGNWTAFGPKVFGGRMLTLAINPSLNSLSNNTIFAGSASGGIWRSYKAGIGAGAWHPVPTGLNVLGVSSIVYHPSDTNVLLAGTGEIYRYERLTSGANSSNQVGNIGRNVWKARGSYGIGILKTTDAGKTWRNVMPRSSGDIFGIQKIKYHPTIANTIFACATDGLYKSTDGGESWAKIYAADYVSDIVIHSDASSAQTILIAVGNLTNATKGIYRSTNGGTVFTKVSVGLPASFLGFINFAYNSGATVFASIGMGDINGNGSYDETEVYRTTDFGSNWAGISNSNHSRFQSWFAHCLTPFPGNNARFFMAGVNKFVLSIGSGTTGTATPIGTGSPTGSTAYITDGTSEGTNYLHDDVHEIRFVPGSSTIAYFATDGGIFRTTNAGATTPTFSSCNGGLQVQQFYPTIAQSTNSNIVIGGLQDNNVIRFNGTGWARVIGGDGGPCMFMPGNENIVLGSRDTRAVYRSINKGSSFSSTPVMSYLGTVPVGNDDRTSFMSPIAVSPADPNKMYVASDNFHYSSNGGTSFSYDAPSSMTNYIDAFHKPAVAMAVSPKDANKVYVSVSPFAQNLSTDGVYYNPPARVFMTANAPNAGKATGKTPFTNVSGTLPDRYATDFAISPTYDDSVFVTLSGFGTKHVYVTGDGGKNWTALGADLPDVPFNTILIDPLNPKVIYAGSDFGIYVSPDRGANWFDYNNGLWDATYVMDLVVTSDNKLRAATHGKGIFDSPLFELSALPVTFNSFKGQKQEQHNLLQWTVSEESQLEGYQVEKSTDGIAYKTVATVRARNLDGTQVYEHKDYQVGGSFYYRIKSVDLDGTYQYSSVVFLNRSNGEKMTLLVNPVTTTIPLQFHVLQKGTVALRLVNNAGQVIRAAQASLQAGTSNYNLSDLQSLPQGVYYLEATFNRQRWVEKVVKN